MDFPSVSAPTPNQSVLSFNKYFVKSYNRCFVYSSEVKSHLWVNNTNVWPMPVELYDQMKVGVGDCTKYLLASTRKLSNIRQNAIGT